MDEEKKAKILIIDDSPDFREIVGRKLEMDGFAVVYAENGEDGIAALKNEKPDLTLLDVQMPKMDGSETIARIHADPELQGAKVVFLTSLGEPQGVMARQDEQFARDVGAIGYIKKTEELGRIIRAVHGFLGIKQAGTQ